MHRHRLFFSGLSRNKSKLQVEMSDQASKDEAAKARIISHMNADHHDSVSTAMFRTLSHLLMIML